MDLIPNIYTQPTDTLYLQILPLSFNDLLNLSQSNRRLRQILQDDNFWRMKFEYDYGFLPDVAQNNYRYLYENYNNIYYGFDININKLIKSKHHKAGQIACVKNIVYFVDYYGQLWAKTKVSSIDIGFYGYGDVVGLTAVISPEQQEQFWMVPSKNKIAKIFGGKILMYIDINRRLWELEYAKYTESNFLIEKHLNTSDIPVKTAGLGGYVVIFSDMNDNAYWIDVYNNRIDLNIKAKYISSGNTNYVCIIDLNNQLWFYENPSQRRLLASDVVSVSVSENIIVYMDTSEKIYYLKLDDIDIIPREIKISTNIKVKKIRINNQLVYIIDDQDTGYLLRNRFGIIYDPPEKINNYKITDICFGVNNTMILGTKIRNA